MCAGGGDATIGDERIHWRTKRTGEVRNRIGDISMRSAGAMLGTAIAASLLFAAPAGAAPPNTWGAVGSLNSARALAASAVLPGGKVLVAGGTGANVLSSSEISDPVTDTWSPGPAMSTRESGRSPSRSPPATCWSSAVRTRTATR